jgi:hypothetical protein
MQYEAASARTSTTPSAAVKVAPSYVPFVAKKFSSAVAATRRFAVAAASTACCSTVCACVDAELSPLEDAAYR